MTAAAATAAIARWWFAPAPRERIAALRILVGSYACVSAALRLPDVASTAALPARQFAPVGLAHLVAHPLAPALVIALALATVVACAAFAAGFAWRASAPIAAALLAWTLSYRNSWGMVFHTDDLLVLHVVAIACAPAADAWALGARARAPTRSADAGYGWPLKLCAALTAATYVLAAIAKLRIAGLGWADGELLRNQVAFDNLRKAVLGDTVAPLASWLLDHPGAFAALSVASLALELLAPIALVGGRVARAWALAAWGFHVGVVLAMNIVFPYPLLGLAFLPLLAPERAIAAVIRVASRRRE